MRTRKNHIKSGSVTGMFLLLLLSTAGYSQDPGGSPDGPPPAVPFDDYLHIILLVAGSLLALFILRRNYRKATNTTNA